MDLLTNKNYNRILRIIVYLTGAFCTGIPVIVAFITNNLWSVLLIIPCVAQLFLVTLPIVCILQSYQRASSKRGLIHESDIYNLFKQNGTAKLHVGDIDTLPRYNVEIPEAKWRLVPVEAFWIGDEQEWMKTGKMTTKMLPECTNCGTQFGVSVLENKNWKHCPCCGNRIVGTEVNNASNK